MTEGLLKILLIEDNPADAQLIKELLTDAQSLFCELEIATRLSEGMERLAAGKFEAVLLDLTLPDSLALDTLTQLRSRDLEVPIIVLSGVEDVTLSLEALKQGAQDYLVKDHVDGYLLARAIRYAIERKRAEEALRASEEKFRSLITENVDGILIVDGHGVVRFVNPAAKDLFGAGAKQLVGEVFGFPVTAGETTELDIVRRAGDTTVVEMRMAETEWEGEIAHLASLRDITDRRRAESERDAILQLHSTTLATIPLSLFVLDSNLDIVMANRHFLEERGLKEREVVGQSAMQVLPDELLSVQHLPDRMRQVAASGGKDELLGVKCASKGRPEERYLNIRICGIQPEEGGANRLLVAIDDVTQQHVLEEQLRQAAKLESIGKLAGGVAHDFNNILTGIVGYTQFLLSEVAPDSTMHDDLDQIQQLAERAADLTGQLLAFSRRQPLQPVVLDLNSLVRNTAKMLDRMIGEDIQLELLLPEDLGYVRADPSQLEQILMNLSGNSRDAMPDGGKLTLETTDVTVDPQYAEKRAGMEPGRYVMLTVSDTGSGIDKETQERIFEPFFTTKEKGKGTGLGLATIYGIVKQHGGSIWVSSEGGRGTTFEIYLPRAEIKPATELQTTPQEETTSTGVGTILVVEDEEAVLKLTKRTLEQKGYTVLAAATPSEAERLFEQAHEDIQLLLTDVILPERSGTELYERLKKTSPSLKAIFMSGYTENIRIHTDDAHPALFIQKPFSPDKLTAKVREALNIHL